MASGSTPGSLEVNKSSSASNLDTKIRSDPLGFLRQTQRVSRCLRTSVPEPDTLLTLGCTTLSEVLDRWRIGLSRLETYITVIDGLFGDENCTGLSEDLLDLLELQYTQLRTTYLEISCSSSFLDERRSELKQLPGEWKDRPPDPGGPQLISYGRCSLIAQLSDLETSDCCLSYILRNPAQFVQETADVASKLISCIIPEDSLLVTDYETLFRVISDLLIGLRQVKTYTSTISYLLASDYVDPTDSELVPLSLQRLHLSNVFFKVYKSLESHLQFLEVVRFRDSRAIDQSANHGLGLCGQSGLNDPALLLQPLQGKSCVSNLCVEDYCPMDTGGNSFCDSLLGINIRPAPNHGATSAPSDGAHSSFCPGGNPAPSDGANSPFCPGGNSAPSDGAHSSFCPVGSPAPSDGANSPFRPGGNSAPSDAENSSLSCDEDSFELLSSSQSQPSDCSLITLFSGRSCSQTLGVSWMLYDASYSLSSCDFIQVYPSNSLLSFYCESTVPSMRTFVLVDPAIKDVCALAPPPEPPP